ncbi:response regulator transcription factor [Nodosilinea nodulosa]|uniref:response regulator transcription factor n=1 Tax=Nodosilinea nodulosa TaxID=416001 RepID=UPI00030A6692|nr:response regulator transcription factor [Nodosilinea nodulosa]
MKILLLEDDPSTSEFLADTLTTHRYAVDAIADGAIGFDLASRWPYDLLIIDWLLPSLDGLEVCRRLRAQGSQIPILMLTVKTASADIVAGLDAGADDYLAKSCDAPQLLARVRALLRRSGTTAPVLRWGDLCLDPALTQVTYGQQPIACRPKEYELLELFLRHPQRLLTRSAIIDHLWPMADTPVEGSVTNLIKDLRQRLKGAGLAISPIETVYGLGYRLKAPPQATPTPALAAASPPSARLEAVMQRATQHFRASLEQRLGVLDGAMQALETGTLDPQQRQLARAEAHRLAGGLGIFGYAQAAEVAEAIEELLTAEPPPQLQSELAHRLALLKRSLVLAAMEESAEPEPANP